MTTTPVSFSFPLRAEIDPAAHEAALQAAADPLLEAARRRGYEDGFAHGRGEAARTVAAETEAARERALQEGREAASAELETALTALRAGIDEITQLRQTLLGDAEAFAVELALAAVGRIAAIDEVRADFIKAAIAAAVKTLSPQPPIEIALNPADAARTGPAITGLPVRTDDSITPGSVRVDGGRLLVETGIEQAVESIRNAICATRTRRASARRT